MRKKLKEYSRRYLSVFLVFSFVFLSFVVPVHASSDDSKFTNLIDFQDNFVPSKDGYNLVEYKFDSPIGYTTASYFEFYFFTTSPSFSSRILVNNSNYHNLSLVNLGGGYYKAYSTVSLGWSSLSFQIVDNFGDLFGVILLEALYTNDSTSLSSLPYYITGFNRGTTGSYSSNVNSNSIFNIPAHDSASSNDYVAGFDFSIFISPEHWKKYESIHLRFDLRCTSVDSCLVRIGDKIVESSLSLTNTSYQIPGANENTHIGSGLSYDHYSLVIDLSDELLSHDESLAIQVTGTYPFGAYYGQPFGYIYFCNGIRSNGSVDPILYWFRNLNNNIRSWFYTNFDWLSVISSKLDIIVGGDPAASDARQTQEEINVSVNNQLVGAVEDWNTNIEVVETGYDLAVTKTTPALVWLSSLADGIFNGMGWFGNVYFLVGLISVLMLLLSKSGLASKIGSISRRRGD